MSYTLTLQLNHITFAHEGAHFPLFEELNLQFYPGWSGIIGANGTGKSTLLHLIEGSLRPQSGEILAQNGLVYYVPQRSDILPESAEAFMASCEAYAWQLKEQLGIGWDWPERWEELSGGEHKRFQLAVALFVRPDILLVDEPTNHLDAHTRNLISEALQDFGGIGLLVSHDRELLTQLCRHTLIMESTGVQMYRCGYQEAVSAQKETASHLRKSHELASKAVKKLTRQVHAQRQKADRSDARVSKRHVDKKDIDTKKKIDLAIFTGKDATDGIALTRMQSRLEQLKEKQGAIGRIFETGIRIEASRCRKLFPLVREAAPLIPEGKVMNRLVITEGERLGISGPNGTGKSRLLDELVTLCGQNDGVLYLPQEVSLSQSEAIIKAYRRLNKEDASRVMTLIRRLGSDPKRLLQSSLPSPGESRKLILAMGMIGSPCLIILDEPTNDLDIVAVEVLENALADYEGGVIIVSHDEAFLKRLTEKRINF